MPMKSMSEGNCVMRNVIELLLQLPWSTFVDCRNISIQHYNMHHLLITMLFTSVASSSTMPTLSSLFTLAFSVDGGVKTLWWLKVCACCVTIVATAIVTRVDVKGGQSQSVGDGLSILAAGAFGLYTTALKRSYPNSQVVDMAMMLSFVGLFVRAFV